jgi:hypothetical protein
LYNDENRSKELTTGVNEENIAHGEAMTDMQRE